MHKPYPAQSLEQALTELTDRTLSRGERHGHVVLVLVATAMAAVVGSLLITEDGLPLRTTVAFSVLLAIALAWASFGLLVLRRQAPLLANREVVAGRMAVVFSAVFTCGAFVVARVTTGVDLTPAVWMGATMTAFAAMVLLRAHRRRAELQLLRQRLEQQLGPVNAE